MRATPIPPTAEDAEAWMDASARVVGLDIPPALRAGVVAQLQLNHRLVAPLLAFDLPEGTAPAPRFEP